MTTFSKLTPAATTPGAYTPTGYVDFHTGVLAAITSMGFVQTSDSGQQAGLPVQGSTGTYKVFKWTSATGQEVLLRVSYNSNNSIALTAGVGSDGAGNLSAGSLQAAYLWAGSGVSGDHTIKSTSSGQHFALMMWSGTRWMVIAGGESGDTDKELLTVYRGDDTLSYTDQWVYLKGRGAIGSTLQYCFVPGTPTTPLVSGYAPLYRHVAMGVSRYILVDWACTSHSQHTSAGEPFTTNVYGVDRAWVPTPGLGAVTDGSNYLTNYRLLVPWE